MLLGVPVSDRAANLIKKIEALLFSQMAEITDEIGDGVIIARSAMTLEHRNCGGSRRSVCLAYRACIPLIPAALNESQRRQAALP